MTETEVPVLVVGGGYAGLTTALFLAGQGVRCLVADRHGGPSIQGRARGINPRTMEIYRAYGIADAVTEAGRPFEREQGVAHCRTLAGPWRWLFEGGQPPVSPGLSAGAFTMADQSGVEPVLIEAARANGAAFRPRTTVTGVAADPDGVTARLEHRDTGAVETVRADYLVAAEGHRSGIREHLGIARPGAHSFGHYLSIVFDADLSPYTERRPLFWILSNPDAGFGGGLVSTATPNRWGLSVTYDPATETAADYPGQRCAALVRTAVGDPDLDVRIADVDTWEQTYGIAERYRDGRVFLAGDAAHVWPPAMALGANTGIGDTHNLAWKLTAVLHGWAGDALLDTYDAERRPLAERLGPMILRHQENRMRATPEQEHLDVDALVFDQPYPTGTRAPHVEIPVRGKEVPLHDLCADAFLLLSTEPAPWAPDALAGTGIPLRCHVLDTPRWRERYGAGAGTAVLVRPDGYLAWRTDHGTPGDGTDGLAATVHRLLHGVPVRT